MSVTLTFNFNKEKVATAGTTTDELLKDMRAYAEECGITEISYGVFEKDGEDAGAMLLGYAVRKARQDEGFYDFLDSLIADLGGHIEDCKVEMERSREREKAKAKEKETQRKRKAKSEGNMQKKEITESQPKMPIKEVRLRKKIAEFVNKENAYKNFDEQVRERILGQKNISEITYNVFMWLRGLAEKCDMKNNAMIVAPSGCGKTETYRVIKDILNKEIADIPVVQLDATKLTSEGYKGMDTDEFLKPLFMDSVNGIAIIVLDEIDKRLLPDHNAKGENVNASIQSQLLTLIEGTKVSGYSRDDEVTIDTSNTLFVAAGAFQQIRDKRKDKREKSKNQVGTIGFGTDQVNKNEVDLQEDISLKEIIENGALPEFMGRFSTIINLHMLDYESVKIIINRYAMEFSRKMKCQIVISESVVKELYEEYCNCELGCRVLKNLLWNRISPIGIELERNNLIKKENRIKIICDTAGDTYHIRQRKIRTLKGNIA